MRTLFVGATVCSTENRFSFIGQFLSPQWSRLWPKTNIYCGSEPQGPNGGARFNRVWPGASPPAGMTQWICG